MPVVWLRVLLIALLVATFTLAPRGAGAQQSDSARKAAAAKAADTTRGVRPELRPPISPRRSFFLSFAVPGYSQSVLGRPRASALFIAAEVVGVSMLRQAQADLRLARAAGQDSVIVSWSNPATGQAQRLAQPSPYDADLLRSRHAHVEDWIAAIVANHLFAGLDAYVAANLWDLPAELAVAPAPSGLMLTVSVHRK